VTVKKCDCNLTLKIKLLNFKIKSTGYFLNSVKFMNFIILNS